MAIARLLAPLVTAAVAAAAPAPAAASCDTVAAAYGLTLAERSGAVEVTDAAATAGASPGDVLLQVNADRIERCADVARAIADAERRGLALLLLVRHGSEQVVLALTAASAPSAPAVAARPPTGGALVASAPTAATIAPSAAKPAPAPSTPAPPAWRPEAIASSGPVSLDAVVAALGALASRAPSGLVAYREAVREASGMVAAVDGSPPPERRAALQAVLMDHQAAVVAWEAMDALRHRQGWRRDMPISEQAASAYFADSPTAAMLAEVPALAPAVGDRPSGGFIERGGSWYPARARRLAWEDAGARLGRLLAETAAP